jgi:lysophospholipid acyltransferase (LPLAT)-like uncharacterized protein
MKIRHPFVIKLIGFLGAWFLRAYLATVRYCYRPRGIYLAPDAPAIPGPFIYVVWHEYLLMPCLAYVSKGKVTKVLISQHADGEMISQACRHLGVGVIRGSSTRGGAEALLRMMEACNESHLLVIPDGPRGPRRRVSLGVVYLASRTGLPIIPAGVGFDRPWRLKSWDRFAIPRPFSKVVTVSEEAVYVPANLDKAELERYRQKVETELLRVTAMAEQLAEGRQEPASPDAESQAHRRAA